MYKHILLAADFEKEDRLVVEKVEKLSKIIDAKISLIHVIDPLPPIYMGEEFSVSAAYGVSEEELEKSARDMLQPTADRLDIPDTNITTPSGGVRNEIIKYAEAQGVDLIVLGSHGRHGIQLLLGSTANAILHHANCDVLTVRISE